MELSARGSAVLTAAQFDAYTARGYGLCRIPRGEKKPTAPRWPLTPRQSSADFSEGDNVGLICGPLSGNRVCVDLDFNSDDTDAWQAADEVLPDTGEIDGRPGKPRAHRFYVLTDPEWPDSVLPGPLTLTREAMDSGKLPRFAGTLHFTNGSGRNIDLLGAGAQVVIPPSLHESGARREWFGGEPGEPSRITYGELRTAVAALAQRLGLKGKRETSGSDQPGPPDGAALAAVPHGERVRRLKAYLDKCPPRRHGAGEGFHVQQYRVACVCAEFGVPVDDARPLYEAWNRGSATPDPAAVNLATLDRAYRTAVFGAKLDTAQQDFVAANVTVTAAAPAQDGAATVGAAASSRIMVRRFSETHERKPDWLWPGYLLRKATHVLGGKQGSSKGLVTVDLAARVSRGQPMPDGTGGGRAGRVLICTREDDPEMALKPRLRAAGADMANVDHWTGDFVNGTPATMADAANDLIRVVIERGIDLLIVDPLGAWVEEDGNNGAQIRAVIDPLNRLARETGCSVLLVAHLRKGEAEDPMDAFAGSTQVTAAVRVAWLIRKIEGSPNVPCRCPVTCARSEGQRDKSMGQGWVFCPTTLRAPIRRGEVMGRDKQRERRDRGQLGGHGTSAVQCGHPDTQPPLA